MPGAPSEHFLDLQLTQAQRMDPIQMRFAPQLWLVMPGLLKVSGPAQNDEKMSAVMSSLTGCQLVVHVRCAGLDTVLTG